MRQGCVATLLLIVLLCVTACAGDGDIIAYQSEPLHLRVAYEIGGAELQAEVTLGAGGQNRDVNLTICSPEEAAGLTFSRIDGQCSVTCGERQIPVSNFMTALETLDLFCIPVEARVTSIEKEGARRIVTLTHDGVVYTLRFEGTNVVPVFISRDEGQRYLALTVLEVLP